MVVLRAVLMSVTLTSVTLAVFSGAVAAVVTYPKKPDNYVPCYRDDPNFNECFQKSLQHLFNTFTKPGIPEFGLEPLDPLLVPDVIVDYNLYDIKSKIIISNLTFLGFNDMQIGKIRSNFTNSRDKFNMDVGVYYPRMIIKGHYVIHGSFFQFPLQGKGDFNMSMARVNGTQKLTGGFEKRAGEDYVKLDYINYRPSIGTMTVYADDLFTGNKVLSDAALLAMNLLWRVWYNLTVRDLSKTWGGITTTVTNKVFNHIPYDIMFPLRTEQQTTQTNDTVFHNNNVVFNNNKNR